MFLAGELVFADCEGNGLDKGDNSNEDAPALWI